MLTYLENIWNQPATQTLTTRFGILLYWLPLVVCIVGNLCQFVQVYRSDLREREGRNGYYTPTLTVGHVLAWVLITVTPGVNLMVACFYHGPCIISNIFSRMSKMFDFPLVPDSDSYKQKRKQLAYNASKPGTISK